jgi:hypothetical protein
MPLADKLAVLDAFPLHADAWMCTQCDNFGVFSDWQQG